LAKRVISSPPVLPGYTYIRPLGSGGFADVYLYEQDMPRRVVAVKVLTADIVDPEVLRTFNAEADILARLSAHPAIVTIYHAGISADGRPYFVMEFCPDSMSARYRKGPLGVDEVLAAGVRMAGALETAHRSGLLHRDIKPSNVLLTTLGAPVLADFGIAAALQADEQDTQLIAMSVPWSSPEVLEERVTGSVPSEIWSLGATLYTLLAGRSPFEVEDRARNTRDQLTGRIVRASYRGIDRPDVPARLQEILAKAMHRAPAKRHASMQELAEELRWVQYEAGIAPTPFEVAATEWASAGAPVDFADVRARGPVITTVNADSRRAARARTASAAAAAAGPVDRDGLPIGTGRQGSTVKAAIIGGVVGAVALGAIGAVVLILTGVL
jgi:eukaryotic-like serine/threonine-protein kinase